MTHENDQNRGRPNVHLSRWPSLLVNYLGPVPRIKKEVPAKLGTRTPSVISRWLPQRLKHQLRNAVNYSRDGADVLLGRSESLVPPRRLHFVGNGDFKAVGDEFLRYFIELGGLRPEHRVLDLGCGIGRMARPLTGYLTTGSYEGLDIVPSGIQWCQRSYAKTYPNFHFQLADIQNLAYNREGRFQAAEYRFPFADEEFDFIFLTSVFTHMLTKEMEHYLSEIFRTLRPNGKCLVTYFLLNDEANRLIGDGLSSLDIRIPLDGCRVQDAGVPELAVAYEEKYIRTLLAQTGFGLQSVQYGSWCGRTAHLSYQDMLVVTKNCLP